MTIASPTLEIIFSNISVLKFADDGDKVTTDIIKNQKPNLYSGTSMYLPTRILP